MSASIAVEHARPATSDRSVQLWLLIIAGLVFAMIVVGGATRLTGSGLSITEWRPILGAIPPLTDQGWEEAFAKYRETLQYKLVNRGMSLAEFQFIFWWEWAHRFLGRLIGLAFAVPMAWFWWRGALRPDLGRKLLGVLALGGLQGFIGWYMVQSGLSDRVDVSQYRLALHLTLAFVILALLIWLWLDLARPPREASVARPSYGKVAIAWAMLGLMFAQVVVGALVAGLKAGLTYNTWPLMAGQLVPEGILALEPWYLNFFENPAAVQFVHRTLAYVLLGLATGQLLISRRDPTLTLSATWVAAVVLCQAGVGIWTLIAAEGAVPVGLGLVHQAGAALVMIAIVSHLHRVTDAVRVSERVGQRLDN